MQLSSVHGEVQALAEGMVCHTQTGGSCALHVWCSTGMYRGNEEDFS